MSDTHYIEPREKRVSKKLWNLLFGKNDICIVHSFASSLYHIYVLGKCCFQQKYFKLNNL